MKISNSFMSQVVSPALIGFAVGLISIFGFNDFVLKKLDYWLHDNPIATVTLGLYLVILGAVGIAGFLIDIENLKKYVRKNPVIKGYSKVAGLLSGLTISAILFGSITEVMMLGLFSVLFFAVAWLFWTLERMVFAEMPDERKKKFVAGAASIASLLLGLFAFYLAWKDSQGEHIGNLFMFY